MPGARLRVAAAQGDEGESQIDTNKVERDQVERIRIVGFSFGEHQLSGLDRARIGLARVDGEQSVVNRANRKFEDARVCLIMMTPASAGELV